MYTDVQVPRKAVRYLLLQYLHFRLSSCACDLRSPCFDRKSSPHVHVWAFAAVPLTLLRSKVQGMHPCMPVRCFCSSPMAVSCREWRLRARPQRRPAKRSRFESSLAAWAVIGGPLTRHRGDDWPFAAFARFAVAIIDPQMLTKVAGRAVFPHEIP